MAKTRITVTGRKDILGKLDRLAGPREPKYWSNGRGISFYDHVNLYLKREWQAVLGIDENTQLYLEFDDPRQATEFVLRHG